MQQQRQWQNGQRQQQERQWKDAQREQQQRQSQNTQRQQEQQRVYAAPQSNWGQVRRQQAFEAKQYRDQLKAQQRVERDEWKYARKQQQFEGKAFRNEERRYPSYARPDSYQQRSSDWLNNDTRQPTYRNDQSYQPSYPSYREDRSYQPSYDRGYQQTYPQYYQPQYPSYDNSQLYTPYYGYNNGPGYDNANYSQGRKNWVEPLIRSVIATFFSNGVGGGYYDDYANNEYGYDDQYYGGNNGYAPQYGYAEPSYYTFGYAPTSAYYEPAAYYGYDQYADNELPYEAFGGSLPYNDVRDIYAGGIAGELIQRALGTGYYQGLLEGQAARKRGWGDQYYSDPYVYDQAIYDPYSTSIGDSRRYFSEGYEMGYDDALGGRDEFDLAGGGGGGVDLVSLLLGNVLSLRG
ncbi:MAG: hypothetical protein ABIO91_06360 [Pyrinomonadaceae bacterium]